MLVELSVVEQRYRASMIQPSSRRRWGPRSVTTVILRHDEWALPSEQTWLRSTSA